MRRWWAFPLGRKTSQKKKENDSTGCGAVTGLRNKSRGCLSTGRKGCRRVGGLSHSKEAAQGGVTVLGAWEIVLALRGGAEG